MDATKPLVCIDDTPLTFGRWRGRTPEEIADVDPEYIVWMYENVKPPKCSKNLYLACETDVRRDEDECLGADNY